VKRLIKFLSSAMSLENSTGGVPLACWSISGIVLKPRGQGMGAQRAVHFKRTRGRRIGTGAAGRSPIYKRKPSLRWQII